MVMPCLAAAETVSEWKKSNQKEVTSPKGSILGRFLFLEPPMWTENTVIVMKEGRVDYARLQPDELSKMNCL